MRKYEVVLILQPELDETNVNTIVEKVKGWVTESGGEVAKVEAWGKKRLAYAIRKIREGQYFLLTIQQKPEAIADLDRNLRFLEPVIRHMITVVEE